MSEGDSLSELGCHSSKYYSERRRVGGQSDRYHNSSIVKETTLNQNDPLTVLSPPPIQSKLKRKKNWREKLQIALADEGCYTGTVQGHIASSPDFINKLLWS